MADHGFAKASRLLNASDFSAVFNNTHFKVSCRYFLVLAKRNESSNSRLGLVVAKKNIPTAVQRNRIKRLIRDSFRHQEPQAVNLDLVVLVRKGTDKLPNSAINTAIAKLWQDAATKSLRKHSGS